MARRTRSTDDPRRHRAQGERKPLPSSSSSPPPPPRYTRLAFPCRCMRDAVPVRAVRSCSSFSPLLPVPPPKLRSFRYVLSAEVLAEVQRSSCLSLVRLLDSNTAQVRDPSLPPLIFRLPSRLFLFSSLPFLPSYLGVVHPRPLPVSMHIS